MTDYEGVLSLAQQAGFKDFTNLQQRTFQNEKFYDPGQWLFVIGATSSGKTLVALLSYFYERQRCGRPYRMLFAVPYRALASQKIDEITGFAQALNLNLKIVQSTSEYLIDDPDIMKGKVDIAVIINEKIFMFASADDSFLQHYDLIVLDEIALIQDAIRGIKTDLIMLKASETLSTRIIALGTPFHCWSEYVRKFNFTAISEVKRPIELKELPIFYNNKGILRTVPDCQAVKTENFKPGQMQKFISRHNYIATKICKFHLQRGEKIIIFMNSRQQVRELTQVLQQELIDSGILTPWIEESLCKDYILKEIQAESEDTLYSIMEEEDYRAFAHGIAYHNADVPSTLRYMIERDILSPTGHLRIICSTETLAYGINSNVDVVIIPYMEKGDSASVTKKRFLLPNEYMNYAGRAGRLNPNLSASAQKTVGYVYPIMLVGNPRNEDISWEKLKRQIKNPDVTFSQYLCVKEDYWPFYVLSLFPNSKRVRKSLDEQEIKQKLQKLPIPKNQLSYEDLILSQPLEKLLKLQLLQLANAEEDETEDFLPRYETTDVGKQLSGFIISFSNFERLLNATPNYVNLKGNPWERSAEIELFEVDLFYSIVSTSEILERNMAIIGDLNPAKKRNDFMFLPKIIAGMKKIFQKTKSKTSAKLHAKLLKLVGDYEQQGFYDNFFQDDKFRAVRMLAAILMWRSENCSPPQLYDNFRMNYEQMRRLLEIIVYRIDIMRYSFRHSLSIAKRNHPLSLKLNKLESDCKSELLIRAENWLENLSAELIYQPPKELCRFFQLDYYDLYTAQRLRLAEKFYNKLLELEETELRQENLQREIKKFPSSWQEKFLQRFNIVLGQ